MSREINSMNLAKPSLSHRSFHHSIVTRFPNHWPTTRAALDLSHERKSKPAPMPKVHKREKPSKGYLVCQLMSNDFNDWHSVWSWRPVRVVQESGLSVGGQPPVLHGSRLEVRNSSQVCRRWQQTKEVESMKNKGLRGERWHHHDLLLHTQCNRNITSPPRPGRLSSFSNIRSLGVYYVNWECQPCLGSG